MLVIGIKQAIKHETEMVLPTFWNQLPLKSEWLPAKIGKFSGSLSAFVMLALINSIITAVLKNETIHSFDIWL